MYSHQCRHMLMSASSLHSNNNTHLMTSTDRCNDCAVFHPHPSPTVHLAEQPLWSSSSGDDGRLPHQPGDHHLRLHHLHQGDVHHHRHCFRYFSILSVSISSSTPHLSIYVCKFLPMCPFVCVFVYHCNVPFRVCSCGCACLV